MNVPVADSGPCSHNQTSLSISGAISHHTAGSIGGLNPPSPENLKQNGRAGSPYDEQNSAQRSPSPRFRHCSSSTPTRTPTPTHGGEGAEDKPTIKTKSVSFHSHTNRKSSRRIQNAHDCLEYMMEGSSFIKLRSNGRQYHRYFRLLEDLSAVRWTPTSKKTSRAQVPIEQIKEIRTGRNCDSLRHKEFPSGYNEERIFTILYGDSYESLDLIAHSPEEASIWVTGLNALIGASQSPNTAEDPHMLREIWLRQTFEKATRDPSGYIDQATCIQLITKLDNQVAIDRIKQKLQEIDHNKTDSCKGRVSIQEFIDLFKEIATRPEIYFLMIRYANKDYLTCEDFQLFLEGEQGMSGLTEGKVLEIINNYEPAPDARRCGQILVDGFTKYLLSEDCDIFDPAQREVCQDMTQPLTHYFISTSHNTYLLEDQLKGPSSVDGYIRVLTCGCRCVKVDVFDGPDEPVVYHGNTLTSKVPFRDVIDAIASYSFDYSIYPVIIHLENHCSIRQQQMIAELLKGLLGSSLYVHPPNAKIRVCDLSPEDLKYKIVITCKKISEDDDLGEVSEDDEGGETKRNNNPKKISMCQELSSLISLSRKRDLDFILSSSTEELKGSTDTIWSMSESTTAKLIHARPEEMVNHNKSHLIRVFPNSSRVDSSNYNPQDYWNAGCQMVALNFQTPGQMMDVYEGRFRGNGACGYVLKPSVMREQISVFSATSRDSIPGVAPQILKIKVISGQCLPKPRGSTATKASFIDPYVVIQIFGIPADCTEAKTKTVSNDGNCPVFDESFDFVINLPDLSLVRFVVLDDEFIGDDFIGQCTVPFECLQTGYRHIRLLSSMGEPLDNATLFLHVSISSKKGGKSQNSWGRKNQKLQTELKSIGLRQADDVFKEASSSLSDAEQREQAVEEDWFDLQSECGLDHTANMKQCLKVVIKRFMAQPGNPSLTIVNDNGIPFLRTNKQKPLPSHLHKLETALEKLLLEIHHFRKEYESLKSGLEGHLDNALKCYDSLEHCLSSQGLKGKKANRARENFAYNVRVIRGQLDRLDSLDKNSIVAMEQVESTKVTLGNVHNRDRSPSVRERPKLHLSSRHPTSDSLTSCGSSGRSPPASPNPPECKPKSILKKSNSNIESRSIGYVDDDSLDAAFALQDASNGRSLLKPPLHHSLSYTPGFCIDPNSEPYVHISRSLVKDEDYSTSSYQPTSTSHHHLPYGLTDDSANFEPLDDAYDSSNTSFDPSFTEHGGPGPSGLYESSPISYSHRSPCGDVNPSLYDNNCGKLSANCEAEPSEIPNKNYVDSSLGKDKRNSNDLDYALLYGESGFTNYESSNSDPSTAL